MARRFTRELLIVTSPWPLQRTRTETVVTDADRSFDPAISRQELSAPPAELHHPLYYFVITD